MGLTYSFMGRGTTNLPLSKSVSPGRQASQDLPTQAVKLHISECLDSKKKIDLPRASKVGICKLKSRDMIPHLVEEYGLKWQITCDMRHYKC
jgi:hypothetical protein